MTKRAGGVVVITAMLASMLGMAAPAAADGCNPEHVTRASRTWKVTPTGGDDTTNIQCAIDAAAAVDGSTVRLSVGHFHAGLLTLTDMVGTFRGAGEDETTVEALPDLPCYPERIDIGKGRTWIYVEQGDVTVRDMTLAVTDATPCAPTEDEPATNLASLLQYGGRGVLDGFDCANPPVYAVSGRVQAVTFLAPEIDPENGAAIRRGVWMSGAVSFHCEDVRFWAPVSGELEVVRSTFENMDTAVEVAGLVSGRITMGGSTRDANHTSGLLGFVAEELDASTAIVSHNHIEASEWGTLFIQGGTYNGVDHPYPAPGTAVVRSNTIVATGTADGVGLLDFVALNGDGATLHALVSHNDIRVDSVFGGVFGLAAQDAVVRSNIITGTGLAGVYHGIDGDVSTGWRITGNDLSGFEGDVADYWLGAGTADDLVVTSHPTDTVLDEGTDNTIVGPAQLQEAAALATGRLTDTVTDHRSRWDR